MVENELNYTNISRRNVLKAAGATGALSVVGVGAVGTASAQEFTGWKLTADNPTSGDWKIGRAREEYQFPTNCPYNSEDPLSSYTFVFLSREDEEIDDFVELFLPTDLVDGNWESLSFSRTGCTLDVDETDLIAPDSQLIQVSGNLVGDSKPEEPDPASPGKSGEAPGRDQIEICLDGKTRSLPRHVAESHIENNRATLGPCNGK